MKNNGGDVTIRRLRDDELGAAFAIVVQLRQHLEMQEFVARVERQRAAGYELVGAFAGEKMVGVMGMRPVETLARGKHLHVDDLVTDEAVRGRGYGKALLDHAEREAKARGGTWVFLDSRPEVLTFYEALGYARHTAILVKKKIAAG